MDAVDVLVVGAGVSGLAFANAVHAQQSPLDAGATRRVVVLERAHEPGGYCKTVMRDGFVWDYSGHFFHFRHPDIARWLQVRMAPNSVSTIIKRARVLVADPRDHGVQHEVAFPFQQHTHELPTPLHARCLEDLRAAMATQADAASSFKAMLTQRFGRAICELFLFPYNEKLYACDLDTLEPDAMGRFFPSANAHDIVARRIDDNAYNTTFTYPRDGAMAYIRALLHDLPAQTVQCREAVVAIDLQRKIARTTTRAFKYHQLVTSSPLPETLDSCGVSYDAHAFTANQVLVFNLGFDRKGRRDVHWLYCADPTLAFYRVGFYDNMIGIDGSGGSDRMSLYVECGQASGAQLDVDAMRARVLADLSRIGVVTNQQLVAHHHVVMNPAYVHQHARGLAETARTRALLAAHDVHSIGRYGAWTYCSIEDNIVQARELAEQLKQRL